jgi:hypothetical protein
MPDKNESRSGEAVVGLVDQAKEELTQESKGLLLELLDHFFGDFKSFLSIFKTTGYWFIKPLSIDVREHRDPGSRFMGDFRLVKSLFLLLVIFLVLDTSVTGEDATIDQYATQFTYLLFYIVSLTLFVWIGKLWSSVAGVDPESRRLFQSYLLYEFCTLFFIQGVVSGVLKIDVWDTEKEDFIFLGAMIAILIPIAHALYFFFKLGRHYDARRKTLSLVLMLFVVGFYVIIPAVWNDMALKKGLLDSTATDAEPAVASDPAFP